jgi:RND superfamily putative drug exporter
MQVSFVNGLAVGTASVVAITLLASLTLLPSLLGFVGTRIEVTRVRGLASAGLFALGLVLMGLGLPSPLSMTLFVLAALVMLVGRWIPILNRAIPPRKERPLRETRAYRWSRIVQNHPWAGALISAGVLIALTIPVMGLRLGFSDDGNREPDSSARVAYDKVSEGFGPGYNGQFMLIAETSGASQEQLQNISDTLSESEGVAAVMGPIGNDFDNPDASEAVIWQLTPTTSPQDEATSDLVHELRDNVLPAATADSGVDVLVTGWVPMTVDFSDYLAVRMPLFFGAVLTLSFLLLMLVFRSLLVPLKAVIMNLLSIGAAFGLIVMVFQWGWGGGATGIQPAPVEPFLPMMLFAIVFGLSMDYEVFLLSRIHEEWVRTGDPKGSVADGLAATAKVITAAAAIMVFVFGSFVLEVDRAVRLMGFGLAAAVLLDATIVRLLLVPATMELLGEKNWWLPRWLDRLLPNVNIEGSGQPDPRESEDSGPSSDPADPRDQPREPELV